VDCVTTHVYSQKAAASFGFVDSCLFLARLSQSTFYEIKTGKGRETLITGFYSLKKIPPCKVFLPGKHKEMILRIINNLKLDVIIADAEGEKGKEAGGKSEFHYYAEKFNTGHLYADKTGEDFGEALFKKVKGICITRVDAIYLYLPLSNPYINEMTEAAEKMEFLFGGVVADNTRGHYLVLQYLNNYVVDYDAIEIFSEPGKELKAYIMQHDPYRELEAGGFEKE
jgi:hypothetical protein